MPYFTCNRVIFLLLAHLFIPGCALSPAAHIAGSIAGGANSARIYIPEIANRDNILELAVEVAESMGFSRNNPGKALRDLYKLVPDMTESVSLSKKSSPIMEVIAAHNVSYMLTISRQSAKTRKLAQELKAQGRSDEFIERTNALMVDIMTSGTFGGGNAESILKAFKEKLLARINQ